MQFRVLGAAAIAFGASLVSLPLAADAGLLTTYDLVTIGDRTGSSEVEGRILVGGNFSGTLSNVGFNGGNLGSNSPVDSLTVLGNVLAGTSGSVQSGRLRVVGTNNGSFNNNTGNSTAVFKDTTTPVPTVASITNELKGDSAYFAGLGTAANTGVGAVNNSGKFVLTAKSGSTLAVFNLTADQLHIQNVDQLQLANGSGVQNLVINVTGANGTDSYTEDSNLQGLRAHVIFNFIDATSLTLNQQVFGSVLAYRAAVTANSTIEGGLFAKSFNQTNEIHVPYYAGVVPSSIPVATPEPTTIASLGLGVLAGVGALLRRRTARAF